MLPLFRPLSYARYPFVQAVGGDVLSRAGRPGRAPLIPDFDALRSASFDPCRVHPRLRRFYEGIAPHQMRVEWLRWDRWALPLSFVYVPIARRIGNLCVPTRIEGGVRMSSSVHHLSLPDGGRSRRWVRTFTGTGETFYSAAVRTWVDPEGEATYWSLAFPFRGLHVMVLLRVRNDGDGIVVSSREAGLAGTYSVVPGKRHFVALPGPPTNEVLDFHVRDDAIVGHHEDFIGKRRTFALRYSIRAP